MKKKNKNINNKNIKNNRYIHIDNFHNQNHKIGKIFYVMILIYYNHYIIKDLKNHI